MLGGFNVNVMNFFGEGFLKGLETQTLIKLMSKILDANKKLDVCISIYRISYDENSKQELLFDLTNPDSKYNKRLSLIVKTRLLG